MFWPSIRRLILAAVVALVASACITDAFVSTNTSSLHSVSRRLPGKAPNEKLMGLLHVKKNKAKETCPRTKEVKIGTLEIDATSPEDFTESIRKARDELAAATFTTDAGTKCYATYGWTFKVVRPEVKSGTAFFPMIDDIYVIAHADERYGPGATYEWSRSLLDKAISGFLDPKAIKFPDTMYLVYAFAEAIRFDWVMEQIETILETNEDSYPNFGFEVPRELLLTNWRTSAQKSIAITNNDAKDYLPKKVAWTNEPDGAVVSTGGGAKSSSAAAAGGSADPEDGAAAARPGIDKKPSKKELREAQRDAKAQARKDLVKQKSMRGGKK